MMVCLCEGVSERKVRRAIDHGAATVDEVTALCRAGGRCGGCRPSISEMIAARAPEAQPVRLSVA